MKALKTSHSLLIKRTAFLFLASFIALATAKESQPVTPFSSSSEASLTALEIGKIYSTSYKLEKEERYEAAIAVLYPVLKNFPTTYTVNYRIGWLSYLSGKYANALASYQTALNVVPSSLEIINSTALVHSARSDWKKMEISAKKAIEIDYYNYNANLNMLYSLSKQNKWDLVESYSNKMLGIQPSNSQFLFHLGQAYFEKGEHQKSGALFESVWILNPYHIQNLEYLKKLKEQKK